MALEVVQVEGVSLVEAQGGDERGEILAGSAEAVDEDDGGTGSVAAEFVVKGFGVDGGEVVWVCGLGGIDKWEGGWWWAGLVGDCDGGDAVGEGSEAGDGDGDLVARFEVDGRVLAEAYAGGLESWLATVRIRARGSMECCIARSMFRPKMDKRGESTSYTVIAIMLGNTRCWHFHPSSASVKYFSERLTVPVASTSPGINVWPSDMVLIKKGIEKIRSSVVASCRNSPLTRVCTRSTLSSFEAGTAIGPY